MISIRCKMIVQQELEALSIHPITVEMGTVELERPILLEKKAHFSEALQKWGLELIDDRKTVLIERIKSAIIELVYTSEKLPNVNFSNYLSEKLNYDYRYLSNTFSDVTGVTIEQFIIQHKIERAKTLMIEENLSITEIADKLNYSSSAHLSNQFKKVTGLTPSYFRQIRLRKRS